MTTEWHWSTVLIDKWPNGLETQQYLLATHTETLTVLPSGICDVLDSHVSSICIRYYYYYKWTGLIEPAHAHTCIHFSHTYIYTHISNEIHLCAHTLVAGLHILFKTIYFLWVSAWIHHTLLLNVCVCVCVWDEWVIRERQIDAHPHVLHWTL